MTRGSFVSLRIRLLLIVLLAIVPSLALMLYAGLEQRRTAAAETQLNALRLARLASSDYDHWIEAARQLLVGLAQLSAVRLGDRAACSALFAEIKKEQPNYGNLGAAAQDGNVFCSAISVRGPINISDRAYFRRALETRQFAVGDYQIGRITGRPGINFGYPVLDSAGRVRAIVFAALDLTWLNRLAAEIQLPQGSTLTVIDRNGTILVRYPDSEQWLGKSVPEAPIVKTVLTHREEGAAEALGIDGIPRLYAFAPLGKARQPGYAYISIGIPRNVAFAEVNRTLARNLSALGLVGILALGAAWVGGNLFILRRVNALVRATKRMAAGDLSTRTGLAHNREEMGQLALAFDQMAIALEQHEAERKQAVSELRRYAERLRILREIDQAILAAQSPDEIGHAALRRLRQLVPCQRATVVTFDFEADEATVLAADTNGEIGVGAGARFPLEAFGTPEELTQGKVHVVEDILTLSEPPQGAQALQAEGLRSYINVPLISQDRVFGSLNLGAESPGAFAPELVDIARELADQIAIAIQQACLHEQVQRHTAELEQKVEARTQELQAANVRLEKASRHKSAFLANMSHELRTPLNSILGFCELLQNSAFGSLNEKQARFVQNVLVSGQHLLALINGLLDLSKVEAGKLELRPESFSPRHALEVALRTIWPQAKAKRQRIELNVADDLPTIKADPVRLKQILYNLLSNAVKFTPDAGRITVTVRQAHSSQFPIEGAEDANLELSTVNRVQPDELIEIAVADTGIGMKSEDLPKLFQPFAQLESSFAKRHQGTGLGLALTRELVELHGGTIWAESAGEGKGSKFIVRLPTTGPQGMLRLLVVDDDESLVATLRDTLDRAGYQVEAVGDGAAALAHVAASRPDLVILDLRLPTVDGWQVLRQLRADPGSRSLPVLAITGVEVERGDEVLIAGADEFLAKPFSMTVLESTLRRLLQQGTQLERVRGRQATVGRA